MISPKQILTFAVFAVLGGLASGHAQACSALDGITAYDSVYTMIGDPFQGGSWSNAANGSAWIQRKLKTPATIFGLYLGSGGTDITTEGAKLIVRAFKTNGTWSTLVDIRTTDIERPITGQGTITSPITVRFPPIKVSAIRVDLTGHGWFSLERMLVFADGCMGR